MQPERERMLASPGLDRLRTISWIFDELIRIPGTNLRVGLDALLGILPGGGDLLGGAVSTYAILIAARLGAPPAVIARMAINIVVDAVIGAIPLLGDLFDVGWKANRKNLKVLEQYALEPARAQRGSMAVVAVAIAAVLLMLVGIGYVTVWVIRQLAGLF
ncbi:MAG: DUF4112 domain-containing protein [Gemmatimonadota bacterium]